MIFKKWMFLTMLLLMFWLSLWQPLVNASTGKTVEVDLANQVARCYENGKHIKTLYVSTGMPGYETPTGTYQIHTKERQSWSYTYDVAMPYCNWFLGYSHAIHQGQLPGYPASHGCVRISQPAWFYNWTSIGTKVVIY